MKAKSILKYVFGLLLVALLIAPVFVLLYISNLEQTQYQPVSNEVQLVERSYGEPIQVVRMDIREQVVLSGQVVSTDVIYEELELEKPYDLRLRISYGDYLAEGDLIGYYHGEEVLSKSTGIVSSINTSSGYIEMKDLNSLALECRVDEITLNILKRQSLQLTDKDGNGFQIAKIDPFPDANGLTRVLLTFDNKALYYGQNLSGLSLNTGRVYNDCLAVSSRCVYSKDGGNTYYVRTVESDGTVLEEKEVELGAVVGSFTCITGVNEGTWCDSGYRAVAESGGAYAGT